MVLVVDQRPAVAPKPILKYEGPDWKALEHERKQLEEIARECRRKDQGKGAKYMGAARVIECYLKDLDATRKLTDEAVSKAAAGGT